MKDSVAESAKPDVLVETLRVLHRQPRSEAALLTHHDSLVMKHSGQGRCPTSMRTDDDHDQRVSLMSRSNRPTVATLSKCVSMWSKRVVA